MKVRIKKLHKDAIIPKYGTDGSACFDLTAIERNLPSIGSYIEYKTGLAFEIPQGHVGLLFQRSSVSTQPNGVILRNAVGVIDSDYRGEITFRYSFPDNFDKEKFKNNFLENGSLNKSFEQMPVSMFMYQVGDRIGQMMIIPVDRVELEEVEELSETERGEGGYGSTGR